MPFYLKAVVVGDVEVSKMNFLMQTKNGLTERDIFTDLNTPSLLHIHSIEVDFKIYNIAVNLKMWNSGKFVTIYT